MIGETGIYSEAPDEDTFLTGGFETKREVSTRQVDAGKDNRPDMEYWYSTVYFH